MIFDRPDELSEIKYYEVSASHTGKLITHGFQAGLPVLSHAQKISELNKKFPKGLFKSSVSPEKLLTYKDGKISSMISGTNGIKKHTGFISVNGKEILGNQNILSTVNMGMQGAAAVSGQYYLQEINQQLNNMDYKLNKLIEYHHDEKLSILKNVKIRLEEIIRRKNVDVNDIDEIRELRNSVREVFQEYRMRLAREVEQVNQFKATSLWVQKRVQEYKDEIGGINFNIQVCYEADKLSLQTELAELSVRMKLNYQDPMLSELHFQLKENTENSFVVHSQKEIKKIYEQINNHAENIIKNGKDFFIIDRDREELLGSIYQISEELKDRLSNNEIMKTVTESLKDRTEEQEILIALDQETGENKAFIAIKDEREV